MSMNGINNLSKAEIAKLALAQKSGKSSSTQKAEYLTKDGSIFNAPKATQNEQPKSLSELISLNVDNLKTKSQCEQALKDLETFTERNPFLGHILRNKTDEIKAKKSQLGHQESMQNLDNIKNGVSSDSKSSTAQGTQSDDEAKQAEAAAKAKNISASEGKKMAADMDKTSSEVKSKQAETEKNTKQANSYQKDAQKQQKNIVKQQKSLQQQQKSTTKQVQENQKEIQTLSESMENDNAEIENLQAELESLTAGDNTGVGIKSAFSLSLAGTEENQKAQQAENPNASRIAELEGQIEAKTSSMQTTGQRIGKLQTSTNKQIKTMHKVTTKYNTAINTAQNNLEKNQSSTQKILKVANTIDEISQTVQQVGQTLDYTGKALVALGSASSWCFGAGSALIAAGTVMQKAGNVAIVVGQYGSLAANVTKTACYAAEGNIAGALTSAASAVSAGDSAIKGTKEMGTTFNKISEEADKATQKLAAGVVAKEAAKEAKEKAGELSQKELTNAAKDNAMEAFEGKSRDEIKSAMTDKAKTEAGKQAAANLKETATNAASEGINTAIDKTAGMTKAQIKEGIQNGTIKIGANSSNIVKEAAQEVKKEAKEKTKLNAGNIANGLNTASAIIGNFTQTKGNQQTQKTAYATPPSWASLQKLNQIQNRNAARMRMYA